MKKIVIAVMTFLTFLSALTGLGQLTVKADSSSSFSVAAKAAIAVDASSGKILYSQNATDATLGIASISKLLTAYMVYEQLKEGKLRWDEKIPISTYAYNLSQSLTASGIPFAQGESFTVKDLMDALLIPSSNAAAVAFAEKIAGTEPKFVDMMKTQLKAWGVTDEKLVNASGLSNSDIPQDNWYPHTTATDENEMSAEDVATVAIHLLRDFPQILDITSQTSLIFDKGGRSQTTLYTTNQMLAGQGFSYSNSGVDGLKTGNTAYAGQCFAGTTLQNGFRIITVVLDASGDPTDETTRFTTTSSLMNQVYATWQAYGIAIKGSTIKKHETIRITDAKKAASTMVLKDTFNVVIPMGAPDYNLTVTTLKGNKLAAPLQAGTVVGQVNVTLKDKLGYLPGYSQATADLILKDDVVRANPFAILWNHFVTFVNDNL